MDELNQNKQTPESLSFLSQGKEDSRLRHQNEERGYPDVPQDAILSPYRKEEPLSFEDD